MATFAYSGRTRGGETVAGERIGDSLEAVSAALRREQIQVTKIAPVAAKAVPKIRAKSVPAKNLAVFTRQFSVMIDAGLPLVQCLDILGNQEEHKYFQQVILQTRTDVEGGQALARAGMFARRGDAQAGSARRAAIGAMLFMLSDSLLAWNRFHAAIPWSSLWVLSTYYLALWWIARSV